MCKYYLAAYFLTAGDRRCSSTAWCLTARKFMIRVNIYVVCAYLTITLFCVYKSGVLRTARQVVAGEGSPAGMLRC